MIEATGREYVTPHHVRRAVAFSRTRAHLRQFWMSSYRATPLWWMLAVVAFIYYGVARGYVDELGIARQDDALERLLFFGGMPSVWLQEALYSQFPDAVAWFCIVVHGSWFAVPWAGILLVGLLAPKRLGSLVVAVVVLFAIVLPIFALLPMEPPWMAAGGDVTRVIAVQLDREISDINQVAAMPSLHVALPLVIGLWLRREAMQKASILMFSYSGLVAFEVILAGEHYVVDILGAATVAALALALSTWFERWRARPEKARVQGAVNARPAESGQNLIEFALLTPFVLLFLGAIVVFGLALHARSNLQQGVREGARQLAVGRDWAEVQDLVAGNAPDQIDPADVARCYPDGPTGTNGKVGDPVQVFIYQDGGKGHDYTIAPASGILNVVGLSNITVNMSPVATARLEKSVAAPVDEDCDT